LPEKKITISFFPRLYAPEEISFGESFFSLQRALYSSGRPATLILKKIASPLGGPRISSSLAFSFQPKRLGYN
jgi:hypothetical protein